jgi:quercetin 2,3-dioxygenase
MKRSDFIRKGILGAGLLALGSRLGIANPRKLEHTPNLETPLGFNHLPQPQTQTMNNQVLHKADTRGHADHGWLKTYHSFSFAGYYNPDRMHFGVLRVLNDDFIAGGQGFGRHPHDNMEIITIPLEGDLEHKDSMGTKEVIRHGDVQVMSAGTGIHHSEYNANRDKPVKLLQIWVFPNKKNVTPRYDQISLNLADRKNKFQQILSPNPDDAGVWIHQNAWFHLASIEEGLQLKYDLKDKSNGVYAFVIEGDLTLNGTELNSRDALGIWNTPTLEVKAKTFTELLLMEVPMSL